MTEQNMPIPGESAPAIPLAAKPSGDAATVGAPRDEVPDDAAPAPEPGAPEQPQSAGDPRVDAAIAELDATADAPLADQVTAYESAHRVLQDTLATIDEA